MNAGGKRGCSRSVGLSQGKVRFRQGVFNRGLFVAVRWRAALPACRSVDRQSAAFFTLDRRAYRGDRTMRRPILIAFAGLAAFALSGCTTGYGGGIGYGYGSGYGSGYGYSYPSRYYSGYYDGYYGPIYDGYWGTDGFFYFRSSARHSHYRRADHSHFSRHRRNGHKWREWRGQLRARDGYRMPNYARPHRGTDSKGHYRRPSPRFDPTHRPRNRGDYNRGSHRRDGDVNRGNHRRRDEARRGPPRQTHDARQGASRRDVARPGPSRQRSEAGRPQRQRIDRSNNRSSHRRNDRSQPKPNKD